VAVKSIKKIDLEGKGGESDCRSKVTTEVSIL
jgi:hypothetical protein